MDMAITTKVRDNKITFYCLLVPFTLYIHPYRKLCSDVTTDSEPFVVLYKASESDLGFMSFPLECSLEIYSQLWLS